MARPLVGHRKLHLDRRILTTEFGETRPHPFQRRFRRQSFAGRSGAGAKRLALPQLLAQLGFSRHPALVMERAEQSPPSSAADVNKLSCAIPHSEESARTITVLASRRLRSFHGVTFIDDPLASGAREVCLLMHQCDVIGLLFRFLLPEQWAENAYFQRVLDGSRFPQI